MKSPITGKEMKLCNKQEPLTYKDSQYFIDYHYWLCEDTGEEFTTSDQDDLNLAQVYEQHRLATGEEMIRHDKSLG